MLETRAAMSAIIRKFETARRSRFAASATLVTLQPQNAPGGPSLARRLAV